MDSKPSPVYLPTFLPYACRHLGLDFDVKIITVMDDKYGNKQNLDVKTKSTTTLKQTSSTINRSEHGAGRAWRPAEEESESGGGGVRVQCVVDGRATVALELDRNGDLPFELLHLLRLCAPYNPRLTRFSACWSGLDPAAMHELCALLPLTNISDVRLDCTPVRADDCRVLLDTGRLRRLSLARCQLEDEGCAAVAEALVCPRLALRTLAALSLAGNAIGDAGAHALARMLRCNRTLRLLDISDNRLRDEGALAILHSLAEFSMTQEDILSRRRLWMERAVRRTEKQPDSLPRRITRAPSSESWWEREAALPFSPEETVVRAGQVYCRGNLILTSLNLAYNSLSLVSVRALVGALRAQAAAGAGLVRVQLAGNPLPTRAPEYAAADKLLESALSALASTKQNLVKKKPPSKKKGDS